MLPSISIVRRIAAAGLAVAGMPAFAEIRTVVERVEPLGGAAVAIRLTVLNASDDPASHALPAVIQVAVRRGERRASLRALRDPSGPSSVKIGPHGFSEALYRLELPPALAGSSAVTLISIAGSSTELALTAPPTNASDTSEPAYANGMDIPTPALESSSETVGEDRPFFSRLSAYEPIYVVYGPASHSDTRAQISVKYILFGGPDGAEGKRDGIYIAYTQRMFIDAGRDSNPFHAVDYQPELFYLFRPRPAGSGLGIGGQAGFRHVSNGEGGLQSRSYNLAYVKPEFSFRIGDQNLVLAPMAWIYLGSRRDNPDIEDYRGHSGLSLRFGSNQGLMLTADSRFGFGTGKGAIDATLSYPLNRIFSSRLNLYIFTQAFAGYGESLLDYDERTTRLRVGIGIVR